jgi:outer membrane protein assembly factor BamA
VRIATNGIGWRALFFLSFFFVVDAQARAVTETPVFEKDGSATETPTEQTSTKPAGLRILPAPLAAYKDTYGFIAGVALMLYDPSTQTRLTTSANTNFDDYFKYRLRFEWIRPEEWIFDADSYLGNDLQAYYGEGDDTTLSHTTHKSRLNGGKITLLRHVRSKFYSGLSFEYRFRRWDAALLDPIIFQNESEWRVGFQNRWENRDNIVEPRRGTFAEVDVFTLPEAHKNGFGADVVQVNGDIRGYQPLGREVVWASRLYAGNTWGDPSYSYRQSLGGTMFLRGYKSNRFRGKRFYVAQTEARVHVWKWFGVDTGFDAGDVTDDHFNATPLWSYQAGFRTTLLSQFGLVLRVDWGWAKDSHNFFFNTFEPF